MIVSLPPLTIKEENDRKKNPCVRYISHVKDTTKRYANAILSVGSTANYIKKSKAVVKIAFLAQNNLFQIIVLFYPMICYAKLPPLPLYYQLSEISLPIVVSISLLFSFPS